MEIPLRIVRTLSLLFQQLVAYIVLPIMAVVVIVDVIMRYVLSAPLIWSLELTEYLLLLVFLFAMPECTRRRGHLHVELLSKILPAWGQRMLGLLYDALGIWVSIILIRYSWDEMVFNWTRGRTTEYLHLPYSLQYAAIVLTGTLLIAIFTIRAIAGIAGIEISDTHPTYLQQE